MQRKSPTRRRFPCAGDVPRFHHSRVRQRRVFRTTGQSRSPLPGTHGFGAWWRGHTLCRYDSVVLTRKRVVVSHEISARRSNGMNVALFSGDDVRVYVPRVGDTFSRKERKKDSFPVDERTPPSSHSRERERERERKRLTRYDSLRLKAKHIEPFPKTEKSFARSSRR